jgi:hypothetical protein
MRADKPRVGGAGVHLSFRPWWSAAAPVRPVRRSCEQVRPGHARVLRSVNSSQALGPARFCLTGRRGRRWARRLLPAACGMRFSLTPRLPGHAGLRFRENLPGPACRARNDGAGRYRRPVRQVIGFEFDLATLRRAVGGGSYVRGTEYARQGQSCMPRGTQRTARFAGWCAPGSNVYQVAAFFSLAARAARQVRDGRVQLPVEFNCKHVIALVLSALSPASSGTARPTRQPGDREQSLNRCWTRVHPRALA